MLLKDEPASDYRGTSLRSFSPPPQDHHRTLGIVLQKGPRRKVFLMNEVHLGAPPVRATAHLGLFGGGSIECISGNA